MNEPRRIELNLLGQTLTIRSEATPEYLRRLAKFLEDRVAQLKRSGVNDPLTALSLAALDIADELFRSREEKKTDEDDVGARLGALVALLDKVAPPDPDVPPVAKPRPRRPGGTMIGGIGNEEHTPPSGTPIHQPAPSAGGRSIEPAKNPTRVFDQVLAAEGGGKARAQ